MEVRKGYKHIEVGVIPEDWELKKIADIANTYSGGTPATYISDYYGGEIDWITSSDLNRGRIDSVSGKITKIGFGNSAAKMVKEGSLLVALYGATAGVTAITRISAAINQAVLAVIPKADNTGYLFQWFTYKKQAIIRTYTQGGQPNLSGKIIRSLLVPMPPTTAEQEAIATALSNTDELIAASERLITKKRNIKQGMMQDLLTGKKRLPGFEAKPEYKQTEVGLIPGDWCLRKFEDVITGFSSGATPYRGRPEYYKGNIKWITSGELNYNVIADTTEKITAEAARNTNLKLIPRGTFLMAITGLEAEGTRGSCGIVGEEATTNQSCMALFPTDELLTEYLYHYYVYHGEDFAFRYCQGTKQQSYTAKIVRILPIVLPRTKSEQAAIAQILSDLDAEIEELENMRDKYKGIKQGMMQELLTGKTRLI